MLAVLPSPPCRAAAPPSPAIAPLPPPKTVAEARERLSFLAQEADKARIDAWVESEFAREFAAAYPGLSTGPKGERESAQAYGARDLKVRTAASDLRRRMRDARARWVDGERRRVLETTIREDLPVRLGAYDADRGEFPLLLGYGWPTAVSVRLHVRGKREMDEFNRSFPKTLAAGFRLNVKGELSLELLDKGPITEEAVVLVAPPAPRLTWQAAHESWVTAVAFRPDGSHVVSTGADSVINVWDAETGHRALRVGDAEMALAVAYSPDGAVFATGGTDSVLRLRNAATGKELWRSPTKGMVFSVAFSPDGRFVATGDDGGAIRVWNAASGKEVVQTLPGSPVRAVAFSSGGKTIAAGVEGNAVLLWSMAENRKVWEFKTDAPVYAVAAGAKGGLVAAGAGNRIVALREADGSEAWNRKSDGEIRAIQFDRTGRLLVEGGSGYTARVRLAETGEPLWSASVGSPVRSLAFGPAGMRLAAGSADFGVRVFDVDEGDRVLAAFCLHGKVYVDRAKASGLLQ